MMVVGGIDLTDDTLLVERAPNALDELAVGISEVLADVGVQHVFVAGYVAILAGRARSTAAVDVLIEPLDEATADDLVDALEARDYWGPAMPLDSLYEQLTNGDNIWVAPDDQVTPHVELKVVSDEFDRASLQEAITARIDGSSLPIGPLDLQVAYKLALGAETDLEDAAHLYAMFKDSLRTARLEQWVERLDVQSAYDRLTDG
jgi:hypothetical protein